MPGMGMDDGGMDDDLGYGEDEAVDEMAMAYKSLLKARRRFAKLKKGFDDVAEVKADEHDAPFGDKDGDVPGNEPQPAGDQGGDREDESFGPGGEASRSYAQGTYKQLSRQVAKLTKQVAEATQGKVIAKSLVPPIPGDNARQDSSQGVTREVQEQVKGMSYKAINKFREDIGDLPRHGIIG